MVIFNIYALLQIIVAIVIFFIAHLLCLPFGFNLFDYTDNNGTEFGLIFYIALIAVYTDIKGLKGRVFFVPLWIVFLILALFLNNSRFSIHQSSSHKWFILGIVLFYFIFSWLHFRRKFRQAKTALELLPTQNHTLNPVEYWTLVEKAFFQPPFLFLRSYSIWRFIREPVFSGQDFLEHYGKLINLGGFQEIKEDPYDIWIKELKIKIESNSDFTKYEMPKKDLKRIAQIITRTKKKVLND